MFRKSLYQVGMALLLAGNATFALALSYTPMPDTALLAQSPVVLAGTVMDRDVSAVARGVTRYRLSVDEVYKGEVPASEITVTVPGNPGSRVIPGVAQMQVGEQVVAFLRQHRDGSWRLVQLNLGLFHVRDVDGSTVLARGLKDAVRLDPVTPMRKAAAEQPRNAEVFRNWLIQQNPDSGLSPGPFPAPQADSTAADSGRITAKYTLLVDSNDHPARWFVFDQGGSVTFYASNVPQQGMSDGGYPEFQQALAAWTNLSGSNISLVYGGKTGATGGLNNSDGINEIQFNDPGNEIDGSYSCTNGGVLALGGYSSMGTAGFKGHVWAAIKEADIVTNDNTACFFSGRNGSNAAEIFTHELGHSLGFGHSCGDNALLGLVDDCLTLLNGASDATMRAYPHADGRGASLAADDIRAASYVYGQGTSLPSDGLLGLGDGTGSDTGSSDDGGHDPAAGASGGSGSSKGGGGCVLERAGKFDPVLPLLILLAGFMAGIGRKRRR